MFPIGEKNRTLFILQNSTFRRVHERSNHYRSEHKPVYVPESHRFAGIVRRQVCTNFAEETRKKRFCFLISQIFKLRQVGNTDIQVDGVQESAGDAEERIDSESNF